MNIDKRVLVILFLIALLCRLIFVFWGAAFVYGDEIFLNFDSFSFTRAFVNFYNKGIYSFDLTNPDASYGRLPGYPIFWGIHYVLFGDNANQFAAFSQSILDSIGCILVYLIVFKLTDSKISSLLSALVYCFNPFIILWVPIVGTESLGVFLTLLFFYQLICRRDHRFFGVILALIIISAFYVRPYLGILFPIAVGYIFFSDRRNWRAIYAMSIVFVLLYALWPVRNYIVSDGDLVLIKGDTPGYYNYSADIIAARKWLLAWTTETDLYLDEIADPDFDVKDIFKDVDNVAFQVDEANVAVQLARDCGTGFYHRKNHSVPDHSRCDIEIATMFEALWASYRQEHPIAYWVDVPLENISKYFFKSTLADRGSSVLEYLLILRIILVWISSYGIILMFKRETFWVISFPIFMLIFLSFSFRQLEMRYMLQAEMVLLMFVGPGIVGLKNLVERIGKSKRSSDTNADLIS